MEDTSEEMQDFARALTCIVWKYANGNAVVTAEDLAQMPALRVKLELDETRIEVTTMVKGAS